MLNINGYFIEQELRVDRNDTLHGIGGGLLVYVRNGLIVKPSNIDNAFNQFAQFELLNKEDRRINLNITLVYRSPSATAENTTELCKLIEKSGPNSIFIGDFNFPAIDWVYFKTHIRGNVLDLVLTNKPENILTIEPIGNLANSDHSILLVEVTFNSKYNSTDELIPDWKNGNKDGLFNYLKDVKWLDKLDGKTTEESWTFFKDQIRLGIDKFIPFIPRRTSNRPQWMTKSVKKSINLKQRHYRVYMCTRTKEHFERFKKSEKDCKKAVRTAKKKFERSIATNGNKKPFTSYIKSKTQSRANVGPLKVGNEIISENKEMATILNNAFCNVFTRENVDIIPTIPTIPSRSVIRDILFTEQDVYDKILKLKINSAPGPDGISPRFLKDHIDILALPLSVIFNKSMYHGVVPKDWKVANVTPIFKKGSKSCPENYRPVSLTSVPCKLMESVMRDKLIDHLVSNQLINSTQHGFMNKKSCTTNLLQFLEIVTAATDNGDPMDIIYLDFSKAFDKVPKLRLLNKMRAHSITGKALEWIEQWLTDRQQRTVLNGSFSEWSKVESGVPQGSVLGPLAFVIYINDLDSCTQEIKIMNKFADDTKLGHVIKTENDSYVLQKSLNNLLEWASTWCMEFNVKKCKVMHVGRKNNKFEYCMNGVNLSKVSHEKDIGIIINNDLKPSIQCAEASRRASAVLGQISRSFLYRDRQTFLKLYMQFVRCHLEFAGPAWCPWNQHDIEILEKVQIRAINMISGLKGQTYQEKLKELGIQSLVERRTRTDLIQTFKILKGFDRVNFKDWFTTVGQEASRLTRHTSYHCNLVPKRSKTDIRANFYSNRVVLLWNQLPTAIKEARTINKFTSLLDEHNSSMSNH